MKMNQNPESEEDWQVEYLEEYKDEFELDDNTSEDNECLEVEQLASSSRPKDVTFGRPPVEVTISDDEVVGGGEALRWTIRETKEVLRAYMKYVPEMITSNAYKLKRTVWNKIASEVKMTPPRECNAYNARMKIENMKKTYNKQIAGMGRSYWMYFSLMKQVMDTEDAVRRQASQGTDISVDLNEISANVVSKNLKEQPPDWFRSLTDIERKRHEDKMQIKKRMFAIIETLVERMGGRLN